MAILRSNAALVDTAEGFCTSYCCLQKAAALQFLGHTASLPDALLDNVDKQWAKRGECGGLVKAPATLQPLPSTGLLPCQGGSITGPVSYSDPSSLTIFFILQQHVRRHTKSVKLNPVQQLSSEVSARRSNQAIRPMHPPIGFPLPREAIINWRKSGG